MLAALFLKTDFKIHSSTIKNMSKRKIQNLRKSRIKGKEISG